MSDLNMNIVIGATVNQATTGLETVSQGLAKTATAAAKVDSSLAKSATSSNTAAFALQNLGRVAQDAPFGFIAIQNNLNPLLESFQRLKAESGSTSIALKALAGSFLGPAGIGVALSLVSSAILFFTMRNKGAKDAVEDTTKAVKTLDQVLEDSTVSVQGQIAKVNALVAAFGDRTSSINTQRAALAELTKLDKEHFGALSIEKSSYDDVKIAADAYTDSLIRQAIVKGITDDITDLSKQLRAAEKSYVQAATAADIAKRAFDISKQVKDPTGFGILQAAKDANKAADQETEAGTKLLTFKKQFTELNDELNRRIEEGLKLIKPPPDPDPDGKGKEHADALSKSLGKVGEAFQTIRDNQLAVIDNNQKIENFVGDISKIKPTNFGLVDKGTVELLERMAFNAFLVRDAFESIFQSIESGKNVFDSLGHALTSLLKKLVATAIEAAILTAIFSLLPFGGGGFAAISIKGIIAEFKSLLGFTGFAGGGIVTRPTLAMVGEQGPEEIRRLGTFNNSSNTIKVTGEFVLSGQTARALVKRADQTNSFIN